ncbi:MAG: helix-turn-helix domain-containing protein [Moraxellaceae bacterium]
MSQEGQLLDHKSLRSVIGKSADWNELVKDCIAFANATGSSLLLGIEDGQDAPPTGQQIPADLPDTIRRKIAERCRGKPRPHCRCPDQQQPRTSSASW